MKRIALAIVAVGAFSTAAIAQQTGVPACDEFLTKYEACINSKVPAAQQAAFKPQLDAMRKVWSDAAKSTSKPQLEASCKAMSDQMKTAVQSYGCAF